jgi:hypothetical protein
VPVADSTATRSVRRCCAGGKPGGLTGHVCPIRIGHCCPIPRLNGHVCPIRSGHTCPIRSGHVCPTKNTPLRIHRRRIRIRPAPIQGEATRDPEPDGPLPSHSPRIAGVPAHKTEMLRYAQNDRFPLACHSERSEESRWLPHKTEMLRHAQNDRFPWLVTLSAAKSLVIWPARQGCCAQSDISR